MRVKNVYIFKDIKLEIFNSIETFYFDLQKFDTFYLCPNVASFLKKIILYGRMRHLKKIISRWFGRENEENVVRTRD